MKIKLTSNLARNILSVSGLLLIWWLATDVLQLMNPLLLPSPVTVFIAAKDLTFTTELFRGGLYEGSLFGHALISLSRVAIGFLVAAAVAIPLGIAVASVEAIEDYLDPLLQLLRPIPPITFIPLAILWFGIGLESKVVIIFAACFWSVLLNTIAGVKSVRPLLIRAARSLGAKRWQVLLKVVLPSSIPYIFTGLRIGFGAAWTAIVAAELIAATHGLGYLIMAARRVLASADVITGMAIIGVLGVVFDRLFRRVEERLYRIHR